MKRDEVLEPNLAAPLATHSVAEHELSPQPRSLFGEILDWMLAPLLLVWPMSIAATYLVAASIANAPFDHALESNVSLLTRHVDASKSRTRMALPLAPEELLRTDDNDPIYFKVTGSQGELVAGDREIPMPRDEEPSAAGVVQFRNATIRGEDVRIAYATVDSAADPSHPALVQVAETLGKRSQLAKEIIKGVILPQFIILPVAVILVWLGLSRGIRPLSRLQERLRLRAWDDMRPIDLREAPEEVGPLVESFNQLLARLGHHIQDQRRFIADAAHQMRTPLAGLRTQAELALREDDPDQLKRSLQQIASSSERATRLVNQLLSLARAEDRSASQSEFVAIEVEAMARDVLRDWVPMALEKKIDLGFEGTGSTTTVLGHPVLLRELLKNLLDNAIRHTPSGGTVTVRVAVDPAQLLAVTIEVEDSGPGIAESERELVFERFYRILGSNSDGSGLGLAIVREIAQQHGAVIVLSARTADDEASLTAGTRVSVRLPSLQDRE